MNNQLFFLPIKNGTKIKNLFLFSSFIVEKYIINKAKKHK